LRGTFWHAQREFEALILDFDGTIIDTESADLDAWSIVCESIGIELPMDDFMTTVGAGELVDFCGCLIDRFRLQQSPTELSLRRDAAFKELTKALPPIHGVVDLLTAAGDRNLPVAIASNSPRSWIVSHLTRLGLLDCVARVASREDVERGKPNPDIYVAALAMLEVHPTRALAIEDSAHGVRAAKSAGLFCIAVPNEVTRRQSLNEADAQLTSLSELRLYFDQ
jgi:HAD superfamily hydrolase (TIGR01509 family)